MRRISCYVLSLLIVIFSACASEDIQQGETFARLSISDRTIKFEDVYIGEQKSAHSTLASTGNKNLKIFSIEINGDKEISLETQKRENISELDTLKLEFLFTPTALKTYTATVTIKSNDSDNPNSYIFLKGNGISKETKCGICNAPPLNTCEDKNSMKQYNALGECKEKADNTCMYTFSIITCENGCEELTGKCISDECKNIICDTPPGQCYQEKGFCQNEECFYPFATDTSSCTDNDPCTIKDRCVSGECVGIPKLCDSAPNECFNEKGFCGTDGDCHYNFHDDKECDDNNLCTDDDICLQGKCAGSQKQCDSPPNACYITQGTCENGECFYQPNNNQICDDNNICTKDDICGEGNCVGTNITCETPPAVECIDTKTAKLYEHIGACFNNQNGCVYNTINETCDVGEQCKAVSGCECFEVSKTQVSDQFVAIFDSQSNGTDFWSQSSIAWSGKYYGVVWPDQRNDTQGEGNFDIYFALLDEAGNKITYDIKLSTLSSQKINMFPKIVWNESRQEFAVTWMTIDKSIEDVTVYFMQIPENGNILASNAPLDIRNVLNILNVDIFFPDLISTDRDIYILTFLTQNKDTLNDYSLSFVTYNALSNTWSKVFKAVSNQSAPPSYPKALYDSDRPGVVIAWDDKRSGKFEIYFNRFDLFTGTPSFTKTINSNVVQNDLRISDSSSDQYPTMVWRGKDLAFDEINKAYSFTFGEMKDVNGVKTYELVIKRFENSAGTKLSGSVVVFSYGSIGVHWGLTLVTDKTGNHHIFFPNVPFSNAASGNFLLKTYDNSLNFVQEKIIYSFSESYELPTPIFGPNQISFCYSEDVNYYQLFFQTFCK